MQSKTEKSDVVLEKVITSAIPEQENSSIPDGVVVDANMSSFSSKPTYITDHKAKTEVAQKIKEDDEEYEEDEFDE